MSLKLLHIITAKGTLQCHKLEKESTCAILA